MISDRGTRCRAGSGTDPRTSSATSLRRRRGRSRNRRSLTLRGSPAGLWRGRGLQQLEGLGEEEGGAIELDSQIGRQGVSEKGRGRRPERAAGGLDVGEKTQERRQGLSFRKALL